MAKKRKPSGKRPEQKRPADKTPDFPDRRRLERTLHELVGDLTAPDSPQGRAEELVAQAFEEDNPRRRTELARQAIALWPDCADAYVLLAEHDESRKQALEFYRQGVAAGERALGPKAFRESVGHFWGILQTRPYMRARLGLAHALWMAGWRDEAVGHLQEMLRLNPNDNQGVRYTLAGFLLFLDCDDDVRGLLDRYPEGMAAWAYTRVLLAFRKEGDSPQARQLLEVAKKANKYVPDYLLGRKFPPAEEPGYYSPGQESEALNYVGSFLAAWKDTTGAVTWLRANDDKTRERKAKTPQQKGPLGFIKKWVSSHLPQQPDVWQAECRQMPNWIRSGGDPVRPWMTLVTSRSSDLVLAHELVEDEPSPAALWDALLQAMQYPAAGDPHRPTELQVRHHEGWEALRSHVEEVGITLTAAKSLEEIDLVFENMKEHLGGEAAPRMLEVPGVLPEQVGRYYDAAASFFEQKPWKKVGYESAIKIRCDSFRGGPWYGVLMGQSGIVAGLALYEDLGTLNRMWSGGGDDEENARMTVATSVTFGEAWSIPVADLEAAQQFGWRVARPDAYPDAIRKDRGRSSRRPVAWELELLEGCLRAVPEFVRRRRQDDSTAEEMVVTVGTKELKLVLAWVVQG